MWFKNLCLAAIAVLAPIQSVLVVVGILVFADLFSGILAAHKRGEKITSAAMRRSISKMCIYQLTLISGFLVEKYLISDLIPISKLVGAIIGMVEAKSLLENAETILGQPIFASLISKLGSKNDK